MNEIREDLKRLLAIDYGDKVELAFRLGSILTAAYLYWVYTGAIEAALWVITVTGAHAAYLGHFRVAIKRPYKQALIVAALLHACLLVGFIWLPILMITYGDLLWKIAGLTCVVAMFFFILMRSDSLAHVVWAQAVVGITTIVLVTFNLLQWVDPPFEKACVVLAMCILSTYFLMTLRQSRILRLAGEASAARGAQEQKLASIGRLAGGVAHDFNNALTGIMGNLELYFEVDDPVERVELLNVAQSAAGRASTLVQQLLVFSRQTEMERGLYNATEILHEASEFKRRLLPANVTMVVDAEGAIPIEVDKNLLVTALINLAVNSVDAMPDGGELTLSVTSEYRPKPSHAVDGRTLSPGDYAVFSVGDTGHGIPPELMSRVVDPFFSTKPVGKGSGLGLSMVVGLAHSMEGGVVIESDSSGTTVSLLVPVAAQAEAEAEALVMMPQAAQ